MSGLPVGQLLNTALDRSRKQERIEPPVARFPIYRIMLNRQSTKYRAVQIGVLTAVQTHRKVSPQRFADKREITAGSFELLCADQVEAAEWRDKDVVKAALEWCRGNGPRGHALNTVNDALLVVLLAAHGAPATGVPGDFDLHRAGSFIEANEKPVSAVENKTVESTAVAVEDTAAA